MRKTIQELNKIADDVVGEIWGDERLYLPVYRDDIKSEEQANAATNLPLLYIWNERVVDGHPAFSFSLNGPMLAKMLERHLPRTDPDFIRVRDTIMQGVHQSQNKVVMDNVSSAGRWPSQLYSRPLNPR